MDDHIGHFLNFMSVEKGASGNTVAAYRNDLFQFDTYVTGISGNGKPRDWERLERDLIVQYLLALKSRNYAEATVARKVAAIKSFFQYMQAEGVIRRNPAESLESPRVGRSLPKPLSVTEVDELLEQPLKRQTPEAKRDRAMLELLYATGLRVTELVSLNVDDINMSGPYVRCMGKGAKERTIPIHEQAAAAVSGYLNDGRALLVKARKESALFVNRRGERLTRQGFWLILKQYAKEANIATTVTPHTLRHSFATHMLRGGMNLRHVQELLGHANISTTQVYTQVANEHVRSVYDKAHPRAR
ncbi:MAG TPA: site-specific tyrosine recombinase XerD [Dehalococcoidia bacterium]|jgi:integrase/recombinase XerD